MFVAITIVTHTIADVTPITIHITASLLGLCEDSERAATAMVTSLILSGVYARRFMGFEGVQREPGQWPPSQTHGAPSQTDGAHLGAGGLLRTVGKYAVRVGGGEH